LEGLKHQTKRKAKGARKAPFRSRMRFSQRRENRALRAGYNVFGTTGVGDVESRSVMVDKGEMGQKSEE